MGAPHTWAQVEVTDEDSVARLFDDVVAREGGVHVVVNCAGSAGSASSPIWPPRISAP